MTTARGGLHDAPAPIGVVKQYSARREPIEVRRLRLRMPAEAADPVVEVVHRDEEDVGLPGGRIGGVQRGKWYQQEGGKYDGAFHGWLGCLLFRLRFKGEAGIAFPKPCVELFGEAVGEFR